MTLAEPREGGRRGGIDPSEILDCAAELFADRGYRATNLEHVARRLDVTRQALYYYYPRKHDILLALFDRVMSRLEQEAEAAAAVERPLLFPALLRGHARVVAADVPLVTVLLTQTAEIEEPQQQAVVARRRAYNDRLTEVYTREMERGAYRRVDSPRLVVNVLVGALNMMTRWYDAGRGLGPEKISEEVVALLEDGFLLGSAAAREEGRE